MDVPFDALLLDRETNVKKFFNTLSDRLVINDPAFIIYRAPSQQRAVGQLFSSTDFLE